MAGLLRKDLGKWVLILPSGQRRSITPVEHAEAAQRILESLTQCQEVFGLSSDQMLALVIGTLCQAQEQTEDLLTGDAPNWNADEGESEQHVRATEDGTVPGTIG